MAATQAAVGVRKSNGVQTQFYGSAYGLRAVLNNSLSNLDESGQVTGESGV